MESSFRTLFALLALYTIGAAAQSSCVSYGIDYANGGSYYLDGSSSQYFSFITVFQGCDAETINPVLVGPDGNQYACSSIRTQPAGTQVTSTCGIPFGAMDSGSWRIVLDGQNVKVQRVMDFTVGIPETITVTVTPSIVVGVTSTPPASTITSTVLNALTLVYPAPTVTNTAATCQRIVTQMPQATTLTVRITETRTATDGQVTSYWQTTSTTAAVCHYPTSGSSPATLTPVTVTGAMSPSTATATATATGAFLPPWCTNQQDCQIPDWWADEEDDWFWEQLFPGGTFRRVRRSHGADQVGGVEKRDVLAERTAAAVADITETVTASSTVTSYSTTIVPARVTTELTVVTTTSTVTPAPVTVCSGGGSPGQTLTVTSARQTVTATSIVYQTAHLSGTVWVGQTQYSTVSNSASATACWRAGGWYGV